MDYSYHSNMKQVRIFHVQTLENSENTHYLVWDLVTLCYTSSFTLPVSQSKLPQAHFCQPWDNQYNPHCALLHTQGNVQDCSNSFAGLKYFST